MGGALIEPFAYSYMVNAMAVSALVGGVCAFLSAFLMLKGWSLIGDALSHSIVPGVAGAYMLGLPFSLGAFLSGGLAAGAMLFLNRRTKLKEDAIIGLIFTSFFGLGLFMVSISPTSVDVQTIVLGNILAVTASDTIQLVIIATVSLAILTMKWKDLMLAFFDENHARAVGLDPARLKLLFFTLLAACTVAALQTVGAFLVIALVVLVIVEEPLVAAMGEPAVGLFGGIGMEPVHAASLALAAPSLDVEMPLRIDRRNDHIALRRIAGGQARIAGTLKGYAS